MRKIPPELREEMANDKYYSRCAITGEGGKIEWHHNLIYGSKQVNEKWCIIPLSKHVHDNIVKYKEQCDWIMCNRASDEELLRYSKAINYLQVKKRLNEKYGTYNSR